MNRYKKEDKKGKTGQSNEERLKNLKSWADVGPSPTNNMDWDQLVNYYHNTNQDERRKASLAPYLNALDARAKELQKEAEKEREMKFVHVLDERLELQKLEDGSYYGYAESEELHVLDQIQLEVQEQGLEVRLSKVSKDKWKLEFMRKNKSKK